MSALLSLDRQYVWHPFTQMQNHIPIPIVKAEGLYLYSEEGQKIIDGISSWWVNLHGHTHPYIVEKIAAQLYQLEHVMFAGFTHAPAADLAARLMGLLPSNMSKIFYSDNGACAVEAALKMALQYWFNIGIQRNKIVCFQGGYHGDTFGAMAASGKNEFNRPFWSNLFEVISIAPPLHGKVEESVAQMREALQQGDVACFIFEPLILGSGGMIIYPGHGLDELIRLCKEHEVLTIADEVMTNFGRTGTLFATDQLHQKPDFMLLGKGLTGGFLTLSAVACTQEIYSAFLADSLQQAFLHGHSYTANPLACASALASLDLLLAPACTKQIAMITENHRKFCIAWQDHRKLARCESLGTILVLEYRMQERSYFQPIRERLARFFIKKGILVRPLGNVLYILPPYCIQADELQFIYDQIILTLEGGV